ncbi:MAG: glutamate--tRNA ligase family protein [Candidatus Bathyarchaeia archaeon]
MKEEETEEIRTLIRRLALQNAIQYQGRAQAGPVIGRLIAIRPELRDDIRSILQTVNEVVDEVNSLPQSDQRRIVEELWPEMLAKERGKPEERGLPPLPNAEKYPLIHLRFAPNPDGALHLGGARAAVLCDEYRKTYDGRLTLRFDDSDPRTKAPFLEAYDWIREDLRWLGVRWQSEVCQADRMEIYYLHAETLLRVGGAYVCTCSVAEFRRKLLNREACRCRNLPPEEHLERWGRMLDGTYREGEATDHRHDQAPPP